ncbi:hypothetical protein BH11PLA1_BH11PLA1_07990 [soil metagenome]
MVICAFALLCLGVIMVTSAGMTAGAATPITLQSVLLSRTSAYFALAMAALAFAAWMPIFRWFPGVRAGAPVSPCSLDEQPDQPVVYRRFARFGGWALWPMWAVVGLLLVSMATVYVPTLMREKNGSHRWLSLHLPGVGELSVQPSEIAKWVIIGLVAWYAWKVGSGIRRFFTGLLPILAAVGIVAAFVVIEDLGTGVLIGVVSAIILLAAGARWWHFAMFIPPAAGAFTAAVYANPYRLKRITTFLDPYGDPLGAGYHQIQSMLAVFGGNVWGRGLGFSMSKFGYVPEDTTDFIFGIICEELGLPGAAVVCALYVGIIWAGYRIVTRQRHLVTALIGVGIIATLGVQAIINLAVVTGLAPTKGIALPLLSSGGTGWILTAGCLGLLVNMDRLADRLAVEPAQMGDERASGPHSHAPAGTVPA